MSGQAASFSGDGFVKAGGGRSTARGRVDGAEGGAPARDVVGRLRDGMAKAAGALASIGLFTLSWDRLLNVQLASYNVKLPSLVFSLAFVLALLAGRSGLREVIGTGARRVVCLLAVAIVGYAVVRGLFTPVPGAAAAQVAAILSGAVLPAAVLLMVVRTSSDLRRALRWVLAGAAVAAAFGVYQLFAFYVGWPQGITYTGVGIGTGIGRISAFSYEPAYFAYCVILALGAYVMLRRLEGGDVRWRVLLAFAAVLYLANVRAVPLVVLGFGALLLVAFRINRRLLVRGAVAFVAAVGVALATPLVVASVTAAQQQQQAESVQAAPEPQASGSADSASPAAIARQGAPARVLQSQLQTVNPDEPSSNGPRLALYRAVLDQVAQSPVLGLGPGQLASALRQDSPGTVQDQGGGQVVANNVLLQALVDGGVPLLLLELALVLVVAMTAVRARAEAVFPMAAAWLAVLGVGGMLTSYFFDIKIWAVLALLLVGITVARRERMQAGPESAR